MDYITIDQLGEKLAGRSISSIKRDVASGQLPKPYRISGTNLWKASEVDQHIADQSNKSNPERTRTMTTAEQALIEVRAASETVSNNFRTMRDELNALKATLRNAPEHNNALIEAKANALADGLDEPEGDLIDVKTVQQDIAVKEAVMVKLNERTKDAQLAVKDCADAVQHERRRGYRARLVNEFRLDDRNLINFDRVVGLDMTGLLDLAALVGLAFGRSVDLHDLFETYVRKAAKALLVAARERVATTS